MKPDRVLCRAIWGVPLAGALLFALVAYSPDPGATPAGGDSGGPVRARVWQAPLFHPFFHPSPEEPAASSPVEPAARGAPRESAALHPSLEGACLWGFAHRAEDGEPVPRFLARVYRDEPGDETPFPLRSEEFSAPDGRFEFPNLAPGPYVVEVLADGCAPAWSASLLLGPGETSPPVELALEEGSLARGFVVAAGDRSPVADAEVELSFPGLERSRLSHLATTGPDGAFTFRDLPAGPCRLQARLPESDAAGSGAAETVELVLEPGRPSPILELVLPTEPGDSR